MKTQEDLLATKELFLNWRKNRQSKTEPIPEQLLQKVKDLLLHYKPGLIAEHFKLSGKKIKSLQSQPKTSLKKSNGKQIKSKTDDHFVLATSTISAKNKDNISKSTITIFGKTKSMSINLCLADLQKLIPNLVQQL